MLYGCNVSPSDFFDPNVKNGRDFLPLPGTLESTGPTGWPLDTCTLQPALFDQVVERDLTIPTQFSRAVGVLCHSPVPICGEDR